MTALLAAIAGVIGVLTIAGSFRPRVLIALIQKVMSGSLLWYAVAFRLVFAVALWFSAELSRTPEIFKVLAVLTFIAAATLPIVGPRWLTRLTNYYAELPLWSIRAQCLLGCLFAVFLFWSVWPSLCP